MKVNVVFDTKLDLWGISTLTRQRDGIIALAAYPSFFDAIDFLTRINASNPFERLCRQAVYGIMDSELADLAAEDSMADVRNYLNASDLLPAADALCDACEEEEEEELDSIIRIVERQRSPIAVNFH